MKLVLAIVVIFAGLANSTSYPNGRIPLAKQRWHLVSSHYDSAPESAVPTTEEDPAPEISVPEPPAPKKNKKTRGKKGRKGRKGRKNHEDLYY
jgi:hypothetical protein